MDLETGEIFPDMETGEITYSPQLNEETGEKEFNYYQKGCPKRRFKIPNNYLQRYFSSQKLLLHPGHDDHVSELASAIVFLLPTVLLFFPIVALVIIFIETILHQYSHKFNRLNDNDLIYFQSPLHFVGLAYCGRCREEASNNRISEIQDMRNRLRKYDLECVRRIVT